MDNRLLLLGLLRRQEMHGYQLNEFIDRELAFCTDLKKPTAYFLLNKMTAEGWISEEQRETGNRPPRRVYRLTPEGEAAFQRLLRENLASYSPARFSGDMGLAFIDALEPQEALILFGQRRATLAQALENARSTPAHAGSPQWVVDHQRRHLACELEWMDEVMKRLEEAHSNQ
jgi:DNA-binding PadR family transcriptional regulator